MKPSEIELNTARLDAFGFAVPSAIRLPSLPPRPTACSIVAEGNALGPSAHIAFRPVRASQSLSSSVRHAAIIACSRRAHRVLNEGPASLVERRRSQPRLGLSVPCSAKLGVSLHHCRRSRGPRSYSLSSHQEACPDEGPRGAQEGLFEVRENPPCRSRRVSLAGRIRVVQRQPIAFGGCSPIHPRSGRTSSKGDVSSRVPPPSQKVFRGVRRAIPMGLNHDLECPFRANHTSFPAHRGRYPRLQWMQPFRLPRSLAKQ